jgi:hypothetical protein
MGIIRAYRKNNNNFELHFRKLYQIPKVQGKLILKNQPPNIYTLHWSERTLVELFEEIYDEYVTQWGVPFFLHGSHSLT